MRDMRALGREDWIASGLERLERIGHSGLSVEGAARDLGVTKGSFYWHFRDRQDWCMALLAYWEHVAFASMVPGRLNGMRIRDRLQSAIRDWAGKDLIAAQVYARVSRETAGLGRPHFGKSRPLSGEGAPFSFAPWRHPARRDRVRERLLG